MMHKSLLPKYIVLLLSIVIGLGVFIFVEYRGFAVPISHTRSINQRSLDIIDQLRADDAVKFEIFIDKNSVIAKKIGQFFVPFQRYNDELNIEFIDPIMQPDVVQINHITMQGEMVLSYQDQSRVGQINITELSESAVINAILRLKNNTDEWLIFAEGYGMKKIDDESVTGLSQLLIHLKKLGIGVARMPLNPMVALPDNVKAIVLPAPTQSLDEEMVRWLKNQRDRGISLWWMNDVIGEDQTSLELALDVISGRKTALVGKNFTEALTVFPQHVITENFNQPLYVAQAREIALAESHVLWQSDIGVTLAATQDKKNSRLLVTGDADFVTNQYLNVAANRSFAERIVDWLLYHDDRINLAVTVNQNTQLFLTPLQLLFLSVFFLFVLPLLLVFMAWKQARARKR